MTQTSFWQDNQYPSRYAELCNALYERELSILASTGLTDVAGLQRRLKSLPYYIKRTADLMTHCQCPLELDTVNGSWFCKQNIKMPIAGQDSASVWRWYLGINLQPGLVVPVALENRIILDCVDRLDKNGQGFRTNFCGWFKAETGLNVEAKTTEKFHLLKPNKKVMMAACSGHCWQNQRKVQPIMPSLRELLLSCSINWRNFKQSLFI